MQFFEKHDRENHASLLHLLIYSMFRFVLSTLSVTCNVLIYSIRDLTVGGPDPAGQCMLWRRHVPPRAAREHDAIVE